MRSRTEILARLKETGVVAVIRADDPGALIEVSRALVRGGVSALEITFTVPRALSVIEEATRVLKDEVIIGAGTVLDAETARAAMLAGAAYIVSPALRPDVIQMCRRYDVACMPGALTPTEILHAWELGADIVKVFPAGVGGPQYFKDLKGPFPYLQLMPTGGVNKETAPQFIKAGACAIGVGGELVSKALIASKDYDRITQNAHEYVSLVKKARSS